MGKTEFDAIVVGGGSGGLAFAKRASRLGASVALIEKAELGGTCVNRGCVPKKLMWDAAETLLATNRMAENGLVAPPKLDFERLRALSERKIESLNQNFASSLDEAGVTLIRGEAVIADPGDIRVGERHLTADRLVLATGASPVRPDIPGAEATDTSDEVFDWRDLPGRLVVLGGGYIGCEFAAIFAAFGAEVTLIEPSDRLLDTFAEPLARHAEKALAAQGVKIVTGARPERVDQDGAIFTVTLEDGTAIHADRVLAATGRKPNVSGIGPLGARLKTADSGAIAVGRDFATNISGVHAIGDAADRLPLTPVATRDGETLADQLYGDGAEPLDLDLVATTAFLFPPHAQVGRHTGGTPSGSDPLRSGVTAPEDAVEGLDFHALAHEDGRLIGAALAFEGADEAIAALGALIASGGGEDALGRATGVHPTAAEEILGR